MIRRFSQELRSQYSWDRGRSPSAKSSMELVRWRQLSCDLCCTMGGLSQIGRFAVMAVRGLLRGVFLTVPVELCFNQHGFGYSPTSAWEPFADFVRQVAETPSIENEQTRCYQFFQRVDARSMTDILAFHDASLCECLPDLPHGFLPWGTITDRVPLTQWGFSAVQDDPATRSYIWHEKSTRTERVLQEKFYKYRQLLQSFRDHGYCPWSSKDICPTVQALLAADGRVRFLLRNGKHRLSVLAALGCSHVLVRFDDKADPCVRERDAEAWQFVRTGLVSPAVARRIFAVFFEVDGRERLEALGIALGETTGEAIHSVDVS